ncbi:FGGY family carbohydrate kinase [Chachezhania antarctica]|uniref:FGGY family carbohydrate kinase n=1 Tax=Chachezhania antarctica TaxID=2340860 RepID=UPI000EB5CFAB|nr:FGGY family carbohydrate kinase [Chachezhania antarctica]|tara:strand:+ start:874 stop:2289 length:1416 start_codon:yes stop_codon:yes gene_type:complete
MTILSIDQSTSATTAFLFAEDAAPREIFRRPHRQIYPREGWVEHDPVEILSNIRAAIAAGKAAGAMAIGLANQGESCLAWDKQTKQPLTPVMVWQDARTAQVCRDLEAAGHGPLVMDRSRLPLSPYFSAAKLAWCFRNVPDAAALLAAGRLRLGTTDAYFRDALTGRGETDVATASRTSLMNLQTCDWDADLCGLFGVPMQALPPIGDCNGNLGHVDGLTLAGSIVDQQAALYGHGVRDTGGTKITVGTGAFALTLAGNHVPAAGTATVPSVAWRRQGEPVQYAIEGGVFTASSALNWAKDLNLIGDFAEIETFADPPMIDRGLVFVPALSGLGCPHWNDRARGGWLGLGLSHTRTDLAQAVCEGVALRIAEVVTEIERNCPVAVPVSIDGGMTGSEGFCQFLADVLRKPLRAAAFGEQTSLGVALLAAEAVGTRLSWMTECTDIAPARDLSSYRKRFGAAVALVEEWSQS